MDKILLSETTKNELLTEFRIIMLQVMDEERENAFNTKDFLTCKEVEEFLKVSAPTRIAWTKAGTLKGYRMHGRTRYRRDEVVKAFQTIEKKH
jgi:hypothetical protein